MKLPFQSYDFKQYKPLKYLSDTGKCLVNNRFIYKYLSLSSLYQTFENGLRFVFPAEWTDHGERRFVQADYEAVNKDFVAPHFFATCFTTNKQSEASWKGYVNFDAIHKSIEHNKSIDTDLFTVVQVKINRTALRSQLAKYCKAQGCTIYEGKVCYVPSFAFLNCHLPDKPGSISLHKDLFERDSFGLDDYLSACLMKRKEVFEHEKEIRYILINDCEKSCCHVKLDMAQIVEQISVMKLISRETVSKEDCEQIARRLSIDCQRVNAADIYMRESEQPLNIARKP